MTKTTLLMSAVMIALPVVASGATVSSNLSFSKQNQTLYGPGAVGFDKSTSFDAGIATVGFGAKTSTGDVDASANVSVNATYDSTIDFASAGATSIALSLGSLSFGFDTFVGASANATVDFDSFLGINPPKFTIIEKGYSLTTEKSTTGASFGTKISDTGNQPISGAGVPPTPGISLQAQVTLDGSQQSSFEILDLVGIVRATHEGGTVIEDTFSLTGDALSILDLSLAGLWDLDLVGVGLKNSFDTALGLAASARVGAAVGFDCGDFSTDDDNGFFCAGDVGSVATSPQLSLINPAPFEILWGTKSVDIGGITVRSASAAVPLPAGLPLLLGGLGALGLVRRLRKTAAT